ncbi:DUF120 domain-containing protein [Candidatus Methanomassiliicoccus intestinalis]|uniref:DUF120 domain-containing protein n=1 Tax=Candidatus Methanomassiliicoccus intestinalis TaxID=1406512 RepID=UPI0037DC152D
MNEKFSIALRRIALMGGMNDYVSMSSREFGKDLGISQQSASKRILELLDENLIERDLGARKQRIRITQSGIDALRQEYSEYQMIFDVKNNITITGTLVTGMGEGQYYVNLPGYRNQFEEKLGYIPFDGTLNLKVGQKDLPKIDMIRRSKNIVIEGFQQEGRTFGEVKCYIATIRNLNCAVTIPSRSHYSDTLEVLCKYNLRHTLGITDGDQVDIHINIAD